MLCRQINNHFLESIRFYISRSSVIWSAEQSCPRAPGIALRSDPVHKGVVSMRKLHQIVRDLRVHGCLCILAGRRPSAKQRRYRPIMLISGTVAQTFLPTLTSLGRSSESCVKGQTITSFKFSWHQQLLRVHFFSHVKGLYLSAHYCKDSRGACFERVLGEVSHQNPHLPLARADNIRSRTGTTYTDVMPPGRQSGFRTG